MKSEGRTIRKFCPPPSGGAASRAEGGTPCRTSRNKSNAKIEGNHGEIESKLLEQL